jgi:ribosomal protein L11 methyltransferase
MEKDDTPQSWVVFILNVEDEAADAVSNALAGILPSGLVVERVYDGVFPDQLAAARVPVRISGYLPVDGELVMMKSRIEAALHSLPGLESLPGPDYVPLKMENWATAWQARYQPIPLGNKLVIVPSWLKNPHPERLAIVIDPDMAFGSGTHPTTQMSLILIESCLEEQKVPVMFDIGCGSGILAIAAARLGAGQVVGVDIDLEAIRIAEENAQRNGVDRLAVFSPGSVAEILGDKFSIKAAPLVAANIIAPILTELFQAGLGELVSPGGNLILSGILEEQLSGIEKILIREGFTIRERLVKEGWTALRAAKPAVRIDSIIQEP